MRRAVDMLAMPHFSANGVLPAHPSIESQMKLRARMEESFIEDPSPVSADRATDDNTLDRSSARVGHAKPHVPAPVGNADFFASLD